MKGPDNIAYVIPFYPQLSETFVENEIRVLRSMGRTVKVFSIYRPRADLKGPSCTPPGDVGYRPATFVLGIYFAWWMLRCPVTTSAHVAAALRQRSLTMLRGALSAGWLASQVRSAGAIHIHAHFGDDAAATGLVAADLVRCPFTFTIHAHELYLRRNGLCRYVRLAHGVVMVCTYNIRQLVGICPEIDTGRLSTIYCGVDPDRFAFVERSAHGGGLRLLSVGRLVEIKGFSDLIRAVAILRDRGLEVTCDIVGHGPLRSELESLVKILDLTDVVRLTGPLTPSEVGSRMADADVFVLACRIDGQGNRDSMPVVIKEAMATGLPVVSTTTAAVPEMVDEHVGRLVPPDNPEALADAVEDMARLERESRLDLGRAARKRVEERFNLYDESSKLLALFDGVARDYFGTPVTPARR